MTAAIKNGQFGTRNQASYYIGILRGDEGIIITCHYQGGHRNTMEPITGPVAMPMRQFQVRLWAALRRSR